MISVVRARRRIPLLLAVLALVGVGALVAPAQSHADTVGTTITGISCADRVAPAKRCYAELGPRHSGIRPMARSNNPAFSDPTSANFVGYLPSDLKAAYNIPTTATTATVAIVDAYDAPNLESDLKTYRAMLGLPACTTANGCFSKLNQSGNARPLPTTDPNATPTDPGWAGETTLDVEAVSAVCPSCHIMVIESIDDDSSGFLNMEAAVNTAVAKGAKYVSMSWGSTERSNDQALDARYFAYKGIAYVASAGDDGYGTNYPASSPNVTSVGGTTLIPTTSAARGWIEGTWNELDNNHGATGSGCSSYEGKPAYQAGISSAVCPGRAVSDVSMDADPLSGLAVYEAPYGWGSVGGTSLAAPMVAAMYAVAGTPAMGTTPASYPYSNPAAFNDITIGNNGNCGGSLLCTAAAGWDGPTGLGTPNGVAGFLTTAPTAADVLSVPGIAGRTTYAGASVNIPVAAQSSAAAWLSLSASGLPSGVGVSGKTLTGAPTRSGTYHVTVTVSDGYGTSRSTSFTWKVRNHTIVPTKRVTVSGTSKVGKTVKASYGVLRFDSARGALAHPTVHFQWFANGKLIKGARGSSLKLTSSLRGKHITFRITATARYATAYAKVSARSSAVG